jgi:hypothetical protein
MNNANVALQKTFYTSGFETRFDDPVNNIEVVNTGIFNFESERVYTATYSAAEGVKREYKFPLNEKSILFKTRSELATDPVIKYGTTTATTYKVAQYVRWLDVMNMFYPGLASALDQSKIIQREYNLNRIDINDLDLFKLVFDSYSYYLVIELKYVPGQKSKVKMFKVN